MSASEVNLVAALPAEAKPIASRLGLERVQPDRGFPVYRRRHVSLIVSGPGKINAAAAVAFLHAANGCRRNAIWVNAGIAGHAERQVGEVLLAHEITDTGSGRTWHPTIAADSPLPSDTLFTLDRPDLDYRHAGMVDMEASGFFATASRFSSMELIQVFKVISDNRNSSAHGLSAKQVRRLSDGANEKLAALIVHLLIHAKTLRKGRTD